MLCASSEGSAPNTVLTDARAHAHSCPALSHSPHRRRTSHLLVKKDAKLQGINSLEDALLVQAKEEKREHQRLQLKKEVRVHARAAPPLLRALGSRAWHSAARRSARRVCRPSV